MNFKALITTLAIGASTVGAVGTASADRDHRIEHGRVENRGRVENSRGYENRGRAENNRGWNRGYESRGSVVVQPRRFENRGWERRDWDRDGDHDRYVNRWQPILRYDHPVYRHIERRTFWEPTYQARYVAPMTLSPFVNGQLSLSLGNTAGNGIELATTGGSTYVQQLLVQYSDGRQQLLDINQWISADNPALDIQTDGSPVWGVTVYGSGAGVSAIMY